MPRRKLPPGILDVRCPQYPLPDPASRSARSARPSPPHPSPTTPPRGGGDLPLHNASNARITTTTPRTRLGACVVTYLRERLNTIGAHQMVDLYGAAAIIRALPTVMVRHTATANAPHTELQAWRAAGAKGRPPMGRTECWWEPNPALYRPGGFLRRELERQAQAALTAASRNGYDRQAQGGTEPRRLATGG